MTEKLKKCFPDMLVYKSPEKGKFFSTLSLPSFMRDWLLMKFADENGEIDKQEVATYVKKVIPRKEQWEEIKYNMTRNMQSERFLAKVKIEIDIATRTAYFSLPDFSAPKKKEEAVIDWDVVETHKGSLFSPNEVWGIVELICTTKVDSTKDKNIIKMTDFSPFCPYKIELDYYVEARDQFTTLEWIDVLLAAIDYNPDGYTSEEQKMTMLSRLLPFIEKRVNLIELAPKETGKSYLFSQISKYGWLISGGSISRAKMFYDQQKRTTGLASHYDYVAFDEIQSISFPDKNEMQGVLKGYLESPTGEYRIGNYRGIGESGLVLLGNIDESTWADGDFRAELDRGLSLVENAKMAYKKALARIEASSWHKSSVKKDALDAVEDVNSLIEIRGFSYWLKVGMAVTLPLVILVVLLVVGYFLLRSRLGI